MSKSIHVVRNDRHLWWQHLLAIFLIAKTRERALWCILPHLAFEAVTKIMADDIPADWGWDVRESRSTGEFLN